MAQLTAASGMSLKLEMKLMVGKSAGFKRRSSIRSCNSRIEDSSQKQQEKLDELDQQLQGLSSAKNNVTRPDAPRLKKLSDLAEETPAEDLSWPDFSSGFYWYAAGVLFLITIINNLIFFAVFPKE